ncbi:MAG: glutamate racemase [Eubacteriales bacterium]|nr:glutamate racemase [Eubacteriales bacterium]
MRERAIGVLDSGVGGVSTLRELARLMPQETFYYYGDSKNAPYGTKTEEEIRRLTGQAARFLLDRGIKELVIACNTATSAAAASLRKELDIPVIGIEPAVKPAAEAVGEGLMLVMATPATIRQEKLRLLLERYGKNSVLLPCEGLMEFAERLELEGERLDAYLARLFAPFAGQRVDACVLGCTHYPFLRRAISGALPGVPLFDGNEGTARQARRVLQREGLLREKGPGGVLFFTSGDQKEQTEHMRALFEL